jgi:hypothetical protein
MMMRRRRRRRMVVMMASVIEMPIKVTPVHGMANSDAENLDTPGQSRGISPARPRRAFRELPPTAALLEGVPEERQRQLKKLVALVQQKVHKGRALLYSRDPLFRHEGCIQHPVSGVPE